MAKPSKHEEGRITTAERTEDDTLESSLRPKTLGDFVGQQQARENLKVFIEAAKARGEALDHVMFSGPPGLGKTTLAQIVARELGVNFRSTSGPVLAKAVGIPVDSVKWVSADPALRATLAINGTAQATTGFINSTPEFTTRGVPANEVVRMHYADYGV